MRSDVHQLIFSLLFFELNLSTTYLSPIMGSLTRKYLNKFLNRVLLVIKRCHLKLSGSTNSTPSCEQNEYITICFMDHLHPIINIFGVESILDINLGHDKWKWANMGFFNNLIPSTLLSAKWVNLDNISFFRVKPFIFDFIFSIFFFPFLLLQVKCWICFKVYFLIRPVFLSHDRCRHTFISWSNLKSILSSLSMMRLKLEFHGSWVLLLSII